MHWVPIGAWIAAAAIAVLVLGFCAYEIVGKANRLRRDVDRLQDLNGDLQALQTRLAEARRRVAAVGHR
jgi:hypothetical protein